MQFNLVFDYPELITEVKNQAKLTFSNNAVARARFEFGWDLVLMDIGALMSYEGLIIPLSSNDQNSIGQAQQCIKKYKNTHRTCDICMDEDQRIVTMCVNQNCDKVMCVKCVNKILTADIRSKCPYCRRDFFSCQRAEADQSLLYGMRLNEIADTFADETVTVLHLSFDEGIPNVILMRIGDKYDAWAGPFMKTCERLVHTRAVVRVCGTIGSLLAL